MKLKKNHALKAVKLDVEIIQNLKKRKLWSLIKLLQRQGNEEIILTLNEYQEKGNNKCYNFTYSLLHVVNLSQVLALRIRQASKQAHKHANRQTSTTMHFEQRKDTTRIIYVSKPLSAKMKGIKQSAIILHDEHSTFFFFLFYFFLLVFFAIKVVVVLLSVVRCI